MEQPKRWPTILLLIIIQIAWLIVLVIGVVWYIHYRHISLRPIGVWDIVIISEVSILFTLILGGIYALFILYQRQLTLLRTQIHILHSVTHAFKTPLATMQLYLETITKRELPEETKAELLIGMVMVTQRLKSLVNNFLESARLSSSRRPYTFSPISLPQLIYSYRLNNEVFLKDVELHIHSKDDTIPVLVDSDALEMVFSNLIENAIHYSNVSPRVDIKMWKDDRWAFIEFSDRGIGIPEENYRDIFKRFQRLPEGARLWGSGTGMGLYVVKNIIKAHGGNIRVTTGDNGEGTSFRIQLPIVRS